jgi:aminodeoxyfutalosine deaminase
LYRKFTADRIFTGKDFLPAERVLVIDEQKSIVDIIDSEEAGDGIEVFKGILCPGFINAHCHLELSHLRGVIPEKTGLVQFVQEVMTKREPSLQQLGGFEDLEQQKERKLLAMETAIDELYESGTIAIGDICNTTDSIAVKKAGKLLFHNFIEVSGFTDAAAIGRLEKINPIFQEFLSVSAEHTTLSPHAPYSVSKTLFGALNDLTPNQLITIHNQESNAEDKLYRNKSGGFLQLYENFGIDISGFVATGKSTLQSWLPYFNKRQSILIVHNTFIGKDDLNFISKIRPGVLNQIHYCICINANKYIEDVVPPLELLRANHDNIVLGTDSYASNWQLNLFEEIKAIQAEAAYNFTLHEVLQWATFNGAKALSMEDKLGSFDRGKQPGVVLIENVKDLQLTTGSFARRII